MTYIDQYLGLPFVNVTKDEEKFYETIRIKEKQDDFDDVRAEYSFGYIAGWSFGKELEELKSSMMTIRKTANEIITGMESEIEKEQRLLDQKSSIYRCYRCERDCRLEICCRTEKECR